MPTILHCDTATQQRTAIHGPTRSRAQVDRWIEAAKTSVALLCCPERWRSRTKRAMWSLCVEMRDGREVLPLMLGSHPVRRIRLGSDGTTLGVVHGRGGAMSAEITDLTELAYEGGCR